MTSSHVTRASTLAERTTASASIRVPSTFKLSVTTVSGALDARPNVSTPVFVRYRTNFRAVSRLRSPDEFLFY